MSREVSRARIVWAAIVSVAFVVLAFISFAPVAMPVSAYSPHSAINIIGNSQLNADHGIVSGTGTSSDPYIIEGWEIGVGSGGAALTGISMKNTNKHVEIRGVHMSHCNIGIYMLNVSNVDIKDSMIDNNSIGISIALSRDCSVTSNTIVNNQYGVTVRESRIPIKNNIFLNNEFNISVNNHYVPWELSSLADKICVGIIIVLLIVLSLLLYFRYTAKKEREKQQPPMMPT